jgi:hypothetical protein
MNDDSAKCPGCGGQLDLQGKCCPHCGRWMAARGFAFYIFWTALALTVLALIADIFRCAFVMVTRML